MAGIVQGARTQMLAVSRNGNCRKALPRSRNDATDRPHERELANNTTVVLHTEAMAGRRYQLEMNYSS